MLMNDVPEPVGVAAAPSAWLQRLLETFAFITIQLVTKTYE